MDAKESLCTLLESLLELKRSMPRALLLDFVTGNASSAVKELKLHKHELFGSGDKHDEEHYNTVLDQAVQDKFIKVANEVLTPTPKGKKFLTAPTPYFLNDQEQEEPEAGMIDGMDDLLSPSPASQQVVGTKAKMKIQLIQAIDRKISLDYFAEQQNLAFSDVLDELEALQRSGRNINIRYFVDEVLDEDCQAELNTCFDEVKGDIGLAIKEMGDVYEPEEIRLARLCWPK